MACISLRPSTVALRTADEDDAQDIVTPSVFLDRVSSKFSEIRDYSADVTISAEGDQEPMAGLPRPGNLARLHVVADVLADYAYATGGEREKVG